MRRIVLGSTSPYRREQLESLGVPFDCEKPRLDEETEKSRFQNPLEMAQGLARLKAESLRQPQCLVIGGDQLVNFQGHILGKPHTHAGAVAQLMSLQGKTHDIVTAVCICLDEGSSRFEHVVITRLTMKNLSQDEATRYVELDQPLDCAGSYKFEKNGASLFSKVESEDFSSIVGLPLIWLSHFLQTQGYEVKK